ncbi:MAG TPA: hypothetical protein VFL91_05785 [Thermomicrobiales bacterium]|nr:hypothetical protein [Thermomicrobiales bacterium]
MRHVARPVRALLVGVLLATLVLGVLPAHRAAAANQSWCPPQTGFCAQNAFLDFWRAVDQSTGGYALDILGYPISPTYRQPDGRIVQFYERAIFEWHPENPAQYQVELSRLGADAVDGSPQLQQLAAQPPVSCGALVETCTLATQTNHTLRGDFLQYWLGNGGLPVFGYPLTEQFSLRAASGQTYTAQYFERNRFEFHPENANPRYRVLLGRLGAEVLAANLATVKTWPVVATPNYGGAPAPTPASDQALVNAAYALIQGVPAMRYITDNLAARQVQWTFAPLPDGVAGMYSSRTNSITYAPMLRAMDPHDLAAVTGHEGQHAYDIATYGPPQTTNDCFTLEYRGFMAEATLWKAWYGPNGKPNPVNDFEQSENAILADFVHNGGAGVRQFIAQAYAQECGAAQAAPTPAADAIPTTAASLPAAVRAAFPDAAVQLAAGPPLTAAALGQPLPAWPLR